MKKTRNFRFLLALLGTVVPLWMCQAQITFFTDNFSSSTTNKVSVPGGTPAASSTSYDIASTKTSVTTIGPNLLHLTLSTGTTSGFFEAQALFSTNPISLNVVGDYLDIAVVFTNTAGTIFSGGTASAIWLGLYNSDSTYGVQTNVPVPSAGLANGGLTVTQGNPLGTGACQLWQGYVGQMLSNSAPQIITRPIQNGTSTATANQDLLGNGVGSGAFTNPKGTGIASGTAAPINLLPGQAYTVDLRITLSGLDVLTISNAIFQGVGLGGTIVGSEVTTNVSGGNFLTAAFDGMGIGVRSSGTSENPVMDISSISIIGQSTLPTNPPAILTQPVNTTVTTNGSCAFIIAAQGDNPTYQWYRNGNQKLSDSGNISGSKSSELIISPAGTADQFTGANNGYYCVVAQGSVPSLFTNSVTNTLTLINSTNLIWNDANITSSSNAWDVNFSINWQDTNGNVSVFNFGDPVTFDETGQGGTVTLFANYLSPSSVTVNTVSSKYTFNGSGSIAGPCAFNYIGSGRLELNCVNTYTGGTLISNATAYVILDNYGALSTGPVALSLAGGQMEFPNAGSATTGIEGTVNVNDNFTFLLDIEQSFSLVMLGNLSGTSGKTLTISPGPGNMDTNQIRVRLYGGTTTYNGNLNLTDPNILFASYQASGTQTFNGVISGSGGFMQKGITSQFNGANTYSGGAYPAQGAIGMGLSSVGTWPSLSSGPLGTGPILLTVDSTTSTTGNGFIFATVNNLTLGNAIQNVSGTNNCTLDIGGSDNITLTGPFTLYGNDHSIMTAFPTRSLQVTNTGLTTLTGVISDGGSNYNFNLTGSGVTIFNNTEAYGGITTNSGGTLLVNGQVGPGAVIVQTNAATIGGSNAIAILGGSGTITGPVTIQAGGELTSGSQTTAGVQNIGTLTVNSSVTFQGGSKAFVLVNKTANTHSLVTVSGALAYNGTLIATNISGTSVVGDQYTVFSAGGTGNFTNIVGTPGAGLAWSFAPSSGVLSVVVGAGPAPFTVPPHISTITLTGTNLTVTGTNAQSGALYYMLTSTNLQTPLNQWIPVGTNIAPGANNFSFTITNAVNPKDPRQFYIFSSTNF